MVSGINLLALRSPFATNRCAWHIGDEVLIEITGPCDPCSRMEAALGAGGYNALRVGPLLNPAAICDSTKG